MKKHYNDEELQKLAHDFGSACGYSFKRHKDSGRLAVYQRILWDGKKKLKDSSTHDKGRYFMALLAHIHYKNGRISPSVRYFWDYLEKVFPFSINKLVYKVLIPCAEICTMTNSEMETIADSAYISSSSLKFYDILFYRAFIRSSR